MEWVETTGRTVSEAKEVALDQLGVHESDAEFEVINAPKTGLFGRLKEEARVRARVRPSVPRSKDANNKRRGRPKRERPTNDRSTARSQESPEATDGGENALSASGLQGSGKRSGATRTRSSSNRKPRSNQGGEGANRPTDEGAGPMTDEDVSLEQQGEVAETFLRGLFAETGLSVDLTKTELADDELVAIAVNGDNLGHLIGPRGSTLHSLQEITRTVVQRQTGSRSARVIVDISGYREKRKVALEAFARQIAESVMASSEPQALEAMNPADRKVVHDAISGIEGVVTSSEGEEPRRWVVVAPSGE